MPDPVEIFPAEELERRLRQSGRPYDEFLRSGSLSAGLYALPAGSTDLQQPHSEDEVYSVLRGSADFESRGNRRPVHLGSVIYVAAGVPHHFCDIKEDLLALVLFAPPETLPNP